MSNIIKINDVEYEYEYAFANPDGSVKLLTSSSVKNITLVDNVFNPFMRGSVSIANPFELFEDGFRLRGDGRDEFRMKLRTLSNNTGDNFTPPPTPKFIKSGGDLIEFSESFILLKEENTGDMDVRSENVKSFKIILKDYLPFMDTIPYGRKYQGKVGDIIKEIFIELLGVERVDPANWESGDFEIEYFPPSSFRYVDLIYYLLKFFYGKDDELYVKAIILRDYKTKRYSMQFISRLFVTNSELVTDVFTCADLFNERVTGENPNNPPPVNNITTYTSSIKNFAYDTPLYEWNNDFFINYIVHGYDPSSGVHSMRILRLEDVEQKWVSKFVNFFPLLGGKPKPFLVKNNNTARKFRQYRTPYTIEDNVKMVESEIYNILTFYNLNCTFSNIGFLSRSAGKFVDIVKISDVELDSDKKMFGRWFVTQLKHVFSNDGYSNYFECCKTYAGMNDNTNQNVN